MEIITLYIKSTYDQVASGLHIDTSDDSNPNKYGLTIWSYVNAGGEVGYRFRTQNFNGGTHTPLTLNNYGNVSFGNNLTTYSLTSSTSIQSIGTFYFASSVWNMCNASNPRLYFAPNSTTYIRGAGSSMASRNITFRNGSDSDVGWYEWNSVLYGYGFVYLSDRRIKRDIEEVNDDDALNKILLVQPTTYYYRDETRNKGNGKEYGFIAQQIKEVIPDAVNITESIIATIYTTCLVYNKREIHHSIPQDVAIDTEVQILDKQDGNGK